MERKYESMMVLRPDLTDEVREEIFQKISKKIEGLGGKLEEAKVWAKDRELCYFIQSREADKKEYARGCFWLVNFLIEIQKLPDLKEAIRLEERILRSLIINKEL